MPVYRTTILGAKPLLVRRPSASQARDAIVAVEALTADEFAEEIEQGRKLWEPGEPIELDAPIKSDDPPDQNTEAGKPSAGDGKDAKVPPT